MGISIVENGIMHTFDDNVNYLDYEFLRSLEWNDNGKVLKTSYGNMEFTYGKDSKILTYKLNGSVNAGGLFEPKEIKFTDIIVKVSHKDIKELRGIIPVNGIIHTNHGDKTVELYYSDEKDVYYGYTEKFDKLGILYCKTLMYNEWVKMNNTYLRPQSLLYCYGYNVSNVQMKDRHNILKMIIDNELIRWSKIIDHLEWCISMHKNHDDAIKKWEDDIRFIRKYVAKKDYIVKVNRD